MLMKQYTILKAQNYLFKAILAKDEEQIAIWQSTVNYFLLGINDKVRKQPPKIKSKSFKISTT